MTRAQMRTGYAAARQRTCLPAEELVSGIVGVLDGLVDAAAVGNRVTVVFGPCADLRRVRISARGRVQALRVPQVREALRPVAT